MCIYNTQYILSMTYIPYESAFFLHKMYMVWKYRLGTWGHELQQVRHDNVMDPPLGNQEMCRSQIASSVFLWNTHAKCRELEVEAVNWEVRWMSLLSGPSWTWLCVFTRLILLPRMEIAIKYFVTTELFVCNFVCRCFFWEESNLVPWLKMSNEQRIVWLFCCWWWWWFCMYGYVLGCLHRKIDRQPKVLFGDSVQILRITPSAPGKNSWCPCSNSCLLCPCARYSWHVASHFVRELGAWDVERQILTLSRTVIIIPVKLVTKAAFAGKAHSTAAYCIP